MAHTCELIMLDRDTCGQPAAQCPDCDPVRYFCSECFPEHKKVHQPPPATADADSIASAIAVALHVARVKYKFKGEGSNFGPKAALVWDSIVVEAELPGTGELVRLSSIGELEEFLIKVKLLRQMAVDVLAARKGQEMTSFPRYSWVGNLHPNQRAKTPLPCSRCEKPIRTEDFAAVYFDNDLTIFVVIGLNCEAEIQAAVIQKANS